MDELFRFLSLRPATPVATDNINPLIPSFVDASTPRPIARRQALSFVSTPSFVKRVDSLYYSGVASQVVGALQAGPLPASQVSTIVQSATGQTAAGLVADPTFKAEQVRIVDTLAAMKLLSDSSGGDAAGLAQIEQGYDAITLVAEGRDPVGLRVLGFDGFPLDPVPPPVPGSPPKPPVVNDFVKALSNVEQAISAIRAVPASGFVGPAATGGAGTTRRGPRRATAPVRGKNTAVPGGGGADAGGWLLSDQAIGVLSVEAKQTIAAEGLDPNSQSMPALLAGLYAKRTTLQANIAAPALAVPSVIGQMGVAFATLGGSDYVGEPTGVFPTGAGSIRPVGIGDLLMVKEHVLRYEGGELAHVENILKSESLKRNTRRLERTETTITQETETTKEEESDTQSTDRFDLKRETSNTVKNDTSLKAGLSVDAKYGPFVEVKANADYSTSTANESATKQSAEFSKDVVSRSVSKLTERVLDRRQVTTLVEFEEDYEHGFDNTTGTGHITGYYQWLDKVSQAQVYNYGKRLLFDLTLPEPGTNYIILQASAQSTQAPLKKPPDFTLTADQVDEGNYTIWAKLYDTTGLEPPPAPVKSFTKSIAQQIPQDPYEASGQDTIAIDTGYRAKYALVSTDWYSHDPANAWWSLLIGWNRIQVISPTPPVIVDMSAEEGSVAFGYDVHQVATLAADIEIFCERTETAFKAWQLKTHATITQAYVAKVQAYEESLAQAQSAAGVQIAGQNPDFNQRIIAGELRRQCLTLLTAQQFDGFGALELSAEGYAQPNLDRTTQQMPYVRFFEQALEWEHIVYFFYPYFWGWKPAWKNRFMLDDTDPAFGDFLRAGAARIVIPVRPGFEAAVIHYLDSQGEIWNGGPPPDISKSLYLPIVQEIENATGAPGNEVPVGDPWEVRVPTTLVRLRPNDDLPVWAPLNGVWQETN
jgi:hypothetical protein